MSDHVPFEIQSEIMKSLPVKSLIRFRSVCNSWKSLINSSDFIAHYSSQQQHLLVRYEDAVTLEQKYVSIVDDDHTFPQQKVSVTIPQSVVNMHKNYTIIGCSHGLLCFYGESQAGILRVVIWNPCIRKTVDLVFLYMTFRKCEYSCQTALGFGVCCKTKEAKIVKINYNSWINKESVVEVFTLNTRAWRSPHGTNLPRKSIQRFEYPVNVDGCIYWLGNVVTRMGSIFRSCDLIVSFDVTSEEFGEVNIPDSLDRPYCGLSLRKIRESLIVLEHDIEPEKPVYRVWMMEDGVPKSFKKLFTISRNSLDVSIFDVRGFRKTGEPFVEILSRDDTDSTGLLVAYEPYSKSINNVGINGRSCSYVVYSYMETLLLL